MNCTNCGKELNEGTKFCNTCGVPCRDSFVLSAPSAPSAAPATPRSAPSMSGTNEKVRRLTFRKNLAIVMLVLLSISIVWVFISFVSSGLPAADRMSAIRSVGGQTMEEVYYKEYGKYLSMQGGLICGIYEIILQIGWVLSLWLLMDSKSKIREEVCIKRAHIG